jgi:hypothetical protein
MYEDKESIKVFERQHARDRLAELARNLSAEPDPDMDLMSAHCSSRSNEGWLSALSIIAMVALGTIIVMAFV